MSAPANDLRGTLHDLSRILHRELDQIAEHEGSSNIVIHAVERLAKETSEGHRVQASEVGPFRDGQFETAVRIKARQERFWRKRQAGRSALPLSQRLLHRDSVQPDPEAPVARPRGHVTVGREERLAHHFLGFANRSADVYGDPVDRITVICHQHGECRATTLPRVLGEDFVDRASSKS